MSKEYGPHAWGMASMAEYKDVSGVRHLRNKIAISFLTRH